MFDHLGARAYLLLATGDGGGRCDHVRYDGRSVANQPNGFECTYPIPPCYTVATRRVIVPAIRGSSLNLPEIGTFHHLLGAVRHMQHLCGAVDALFR